ncbi:Sphingosine-1-phosphate phosphatase 1 [Sciurus carolinensis]|uniref:Sphingosine-1-phosphate phosphatase 1 n=1 Tax=Sciurus carolinensis TaxID=30640 RepID=A0AA41NFH5_SCICA|nr:Sphingosine-1-phosphate phosphatase 1 [Sciurus carolinensis]
MVQQLPNLGGATESGPFPASVRVEAPPNRSAERREDEKVEAPLAGDPRGRGLQSGATQSPQPPGVTTVSAQTSRTQRHPQWHVKRAGGPVGPSLIVARGLPATQLAARRATGRSPICSAWARSWATDSLHHVLPFLDLEPVRPGGSQAGDHLGAGHVPGPVHQGHHPLAVALLPACVKLEFFCNSEYSMPSTHAVSGTPISVSMVLLTYGSWQYPPVCGLLLIPGVL